MNISTSQNGTMAQIQNVGKELKTTTTQHLTPGVRKEDAI